MNKLVWKDELKTAMPAGFAEFNNNDHLCIDLPDDYFTISCKTSDGRRITFAFLCTSGKDTAPDCVDIVYHDNGTTRQNGDLTLPTFDVLGFGREQGRSVFDTRQIGCKTSLVALLMPAKGE